MKFDNNSEFIIPLVLTSLPFPASCIQHADVTIISDYFNFITIQVDNYKVKEEILETDKTFEDVEYTQNGMILKYNIPSTIRYICNIIKKCGYTGLTKDLLFDCIAFWKKDSYNVIVNNKNLTARNSSIG